MKPHLLLMSALVLSLSSIAQTAADKKNIDNLCGCFDVQFKYAETFAPDEEYKYHNREVINDATELVLAVEKTDRKVVLQHLLIVSDSVIIKHWREDWSYENPVLYKYQGDKVWVKEKLDPKVYKKRWTQTVWEVSDAPRYQGISEWVTTDGKTFWQNTTDAPLPRREYSKRSDYNVMKRTNRIIVDKNGWIHDQDNQKIIRNGSLDTLLAEEKGINSYKRTAESKCAVAKTWWEDNKIYWSMVRNTWENYMNEHPTVVLKDVVDGKPMYQYLNDIGNAFAKKKITDKEADSQIKSTLNLFVSSNPDMSHK